MTVREEWEWNAVFMMFVKSLTFSEHECHAADQLYDSPIHASSKVMKDSVLLQHFNITVSSC